MSVICSNSSWLDPAELPLFRRSVPARTTGSVKIASPALPAQRLVRANKVMLAPVPPCAGECRFVRGDFVGNHAADPDLWGFCGAEDMQLNRVSRPSGAPGQCQRHGVPGRPGHGASFSVGAGSCRVIIGTPDHWHVHSALRARYDRHLHEQQPRSPRYRIARAVLHHQSRYVGQQPAQPPPTDS